MTGMILLGIGLLGLILFANPYGIIILAFDEAERRKGDIRITIVGAIVSLLVYIAGAVLCHLQ